MTKREKNRLYLREWKRRNPDKVRAYARKWAKTPQFRAYQNAWKKARYRGPDGDRLRALARARYLRNKTRINIAKRGGGAGLTPEQFHAMVRRSKGRCAVCREQMRHICVDHNHSTGQIRGLLCNGCNTFAGYIDKRRHVLRRMLAYLKSFS